MDKERTTLSGDKAPGFTVLEILVVLFLTLCLLWGVLPRYREQVRRRETEQAVALFRNTLMRARQQAITRRHNVEVLVSPGDNTLRVRVAGEEALEGKQETLPPSVQVVDISESLKPIVFRPDGGLAGVSGSVLIQNLRTGEARRLTVYGITGRVRVSEEP